MFGRIVTRAEADAAASNLKNSAETTPPSEAADIGRRISPTGVVSRAVVIAIIACALGLTAYGIWKFDWTTMRPWPAGERTSVLIALAVPATLLVFGSFWRLWPRLATGAVLAAALVTYGPAVIGVVVLCGLGFMAIGQLVSRMQLNTVEDGLLALALGFGLVGLLIGLTAPIRVHFDFVYAGAFLIAILLARRPLLAWSLSAVKRVLAPQTGALQSRVLNNLGVSVPILVAMAVMLYATAMETGPDALTTHFTFTEALREFGFMKLDRDMSQAVFMPKATVWGLASVDVIGGEFALRAAHASLIVVAAALLAMRASRVMWPGAAGLLAATLLSAPVSFWISAQFFEETGAILFSSAAAVFFLRGDSGQKTEREDWAAYAMLGVAVSAKEQALFLGVLGIALVMRRLLAGRSLESIRQVAFGCLIFILTACGFYLRAFLATGNPLYPIVLGQGLDPRWERPFTITVPYDMMFGPGFMEAYPGGFAFQFVLLIAAGVAAIFVPRGQSTRWLGFAGLAFAFGMAHQTLYARYQLYAFPLFMLALAALFPFVTRVGRSAVAIALVAIVAVNLDFWRSVHVPPFSLSHLTAPQTSSYITPERRAFDVLDALYGRATVIYVAGGARVTAGSLGQVHAFSGLSRSLDTASTVNDVARLLRDGKVTHIVDVEPARNPKVIEACKIVCSPFPVRDELGLKIFEVNPTRASLLADRIDAPELLGLPPPAEATPMTGWSERQEWGWWSVAPQSEVQLSRGFIGASEIIVNLQPFSPPGTQGLDVAVSLDGAQVATWHFDAGPIGNRIERRITLPAAITDQAPRVLSFAFSRTYTPKSTMGNGDERTLAIGLLNIGR